MRSPVILPEGRSSSPLSSSCYCILRPFSWTGIGFSRRISWPRIWDIRRMWSYISAYSISRIPPRTLYPRIYRKIWFIISLRWASGPYLTWLYGISWKGIWILEASDWRNSSSYHYPPPQDKRGSITWTRFLSSRRYLVYYHRYLTWSSYWSLYSYL